MKILFAIQGTGNGHLSRARDVYPELAKYGEVDVLISGIQADVQVPFPVKYRFYGLSFIFGKRGGVDILATAKRLKLRRLIADIKALPVDTYDLVISDFEPVSSWACRLKNKPCVSLSHQGAVLHPAAPKPLRSDWIGELVLRHYAPAATSYCFHFKSYSDNIFTPVIRQQIRQLTPSDEGHYTVYLPAYDDDVLVRHLGAFKETHWQVFSKHNHQRFTVGNVSVQPIDNDKFVASMASSSGVLCGAGFESPAEAMYLGKKLLVIPMHTQYEQQCNAAALSQLGVTVIPRLSRKFYPYIDYWLLRGRPLRVNYPDITAKVIARLMEQEAGVPARVGDKAVMQAG